MKRTPLKRGKALKRTAMKRGRRKRMDATEKRARDLFERAVLAKGGCVMQERGSTDYCEGGHDAHHVIPKQALKGIFGLSREERMELVWDARNGVPVCRRHHELLTTHARKLRPDQLPDETWIFAYEKGLVLRLYRELDTTEVSAKN